MTHKGPRILVIEPKWTGHYAGFAGMVADALQGAGESVTLALTRSGPNETTGIPENVESELGDRLEVRRSLKELPGGFSPLSDAGGEREWDAITDEIHELRPEVVLFPSADALACARSSRSRIRTLGSAAAGCIHNARFGYGGRGLRFMLRREWMRLRLQRCGMTLGSLDPVASLAFGPDRLRLLPLPLSEPASECAPDGIERRLGDRRVVLAIGEHSRRKGTERIIDAWPDPGPSSASLVIAGRRWRGVEEALDRRSSDLEAERIIDLDRTLSAREFRWLLRRADVVTGVYPAQVGISAVVIEAAGEGSAVLGSREGGIGRIIEDHGLGSTVPSNDDDALRRALADAAMRDPDVDERGRADFVAASRGARLGRAWAALVGTAAARRPAR